MAYNRIAHQVATHLCQSKCQSKEDLQREFEKAMNEIHQSDLAAKKQSQYRAPIVQRARRLGISQASAEQLALADAARALALLWKV